jgi:peptidoglycan/xylan/chitin deacetylase (PgdA/CDA1 family)
MNRDKTRIFVFHGVCNENNIYNRWIHVPERIFKYQIIHLSKHYTSKKLTDVIQTLDGEGRTQNAYHLIFDDGYENNFTVARNILKKYQVNYSIALIPKLIETEELTWDSYLQLASIKKMNLDPTGQMFRGDTTSYIRSNQTTRNELIEKWKTMIDESSLVKASQELDRENKKMSWEQVRVLISEGVSMLSHTYSHAVLNALSDWEIIEEWEKSRDQILTKTGLKPIGLVYPTGVVDKRIINVLSSTDCTFGFALHHAFIDKNDNLLQIPRIGVPSDHGYFEFVSRAAGVHEFLINIRKR